MLIQMKKPFIVLVCFFTLCMTTLGLVLLKGHIRVQTRCEERLEDFAWTYQLLSQDKQNGRLHEFLKARLYYLGSFLPADSLKHFPKVDFGPVDVTVLGGMLPAPPHADEPNDYYKIMVEKLNKQSERQSSR